jgi:hypothetical protein
MTEQRTASERSASPQNQKGPGKTTLGVGTRRVGCPYAIEIIRRYFFQKRMTPA